MLPEFSICNICRLYLGKYSVSSVRIQCLGLSVFGWGELNNYVPLTHTDGHVSILTGLPQVSKFVKYS